MKNSKKASAFEISGGIYSARKVPRWHISPTDWLEYFDVIQDDGDDLVLLPASA